MTEPHDMHVRLTGKTAWFSVRQPGSKAHRQVNLIPKMSKKHATIMLDGKPIGTAWDVVIDGSFHDEL